LLFCRAAHHIIWGYNFFRRGPL